MMDFEQKRGSRMPSIRMLDDELAELKEIADSLELSFSDFARAALQVSKLRRDEIRAEHERLEVCRIEALP